MSENNNRIKRITRIPPSAGQDKKKGKILFFTKREFSNFLEQPKLSNRLPLKKNRT